MGKVRRAVAGAALLVGVGAPSAASAQEVSTPPPVEISALSVERSLPYDEVVKGLQESLNNGDPNTLQIVDSIKEDLKPENAGVFVAYMQAMREGLGRRIIDGENVVAEVDAYNNLLATMQIANGGSLTFAFQTEEQKASYQEALKRAEADYATELAGVEAQRAEELERLEEQKVANLKSVEDAFALAKKYAAGQTLEVEDFFEQIIREAESVLSGTDYSNEDSVREAQELLKAIEVAINNKLTEIIGSPQEFEFIGEHDVLDDGRPVPKIAEIGGQRTPDKLRSHVVPKLATATTCDAQTGETVSDGVTISMVPRSGLEDNPQHTTVTTAIWGIKEDGSRELIGVAQIDSNDGNYKVPENIAARYKKVAMEWVEDADAIHGELEVLRDLGEAGYTYTVNENGTLKEVTFGQDQILSHENVEAVKGLIAAMNQGQELSSEQQQQVAYHLEKFSQEFEAMMGLLPKLQQQINSAELNDDDRTTLQKLVNRIEETRGFIDDLGRSELPIPSTTCDYEKVILHVDGSLTFENPERRNPEPEHTRVELRPLNAYYKEEAGKGKPEPEPRKPDYPELPPTGPGLLDKELWLVGGSLALGAGLTVASKRENREEAQRAAADLLLMIDAAAKEGKYKLVGVLTWLYAKVMAEGGYIGK